MNILNQFQMLRSKEICLTRTRFNWQSCLQRFVFGFGRSRKSLRLVFIKKTTWFQHIERHIGRFNLTALSPIQNNEIKNFRHSYVTLLYIQRWTLSIAVGHYPSDTHLKTEIIFSRDLSQQFIPRMWTFIYFAWHTVCFFYSHVPITCLYIGASTGISFQLLNCTYFAAMTSVKRLCWSTGFFDVTHSEKYNPLV